MWLKAQNEMAGLWPHAAMGPVERMVIHGHTDSKMNVIISWLARYPAWVERKIGLRRDAAWALTVAAVAVSLQWLLILLQLYCRPCIRTMFESLSL